MRLLKALLVVSPCSSPFRRPWPGCGLRTSRCWCDARWWAWCSRGRPLWWCFGSERLSLNRWRPWPRPAEWSVRQTVEDEAPTHISIKTKTNFWFIITRTLTTYLMIIDDFDGGTWQNVTSVIGFTMCLWRFFCFYDIKNFEPPCCWNVLRSN